MSRADEVCIARCGGVVLRALRGDDVDRGQMRRWLSDPRVLVWYDGRPADSWREIDARYAEYRREEHPVRPCIIERAGVPIGYLQFYPVLDPRAYELEEGAGVWGLDLFLGEPRLWGQGNGGGALRAALDHLAREERAQRAVIDPRLSNTRAIRAYEKVGFLRERVLRIHERHEGVWRDCWLMTQDLRDR